MIKKIWIMHAFKRSKFGTLRLWIKLRRKCRRRGGGAKLILSDIEKVRNKFLIALLYIKLFKKLYLKFKSGLVFCVLLQSLIFNESFSDICQVTLQT